MVLSNCVFARIELGKAISCRRAKPNESDLAGFLDLTFAFCLDLKKKRIALPYLNGRTAKAELWVVGFSGGLGLKRTNRQPTTHWKIS
jgi:hypothetical protein